MGKNTVLQNNYTYEYLAFLSKRYKLLVAIIKTYLSISRIYLDGEVFAEIYSNYHMILNQIYHLINIYVNAMIFKVVAIINHMILANTFNIILYTTGTFPILKKLFWICARGIFLVWFIIGSNAFLRHYLYHFENNKRVYLPFLYSEF